MAKTTLIALQPPTKGNLVRTTRKTKYALYWIKSKSTQRTTLTAPECKKICDAYGIPLPKEGLASSAEEAAEIAAQLGFPIVMKIVSPDILHKTEAGGVKVGVDSEEAAKSAYQEIVKSAGTYKADAKIHGVQAQKMLTLDGQEVIVGAVTDPSFGKLVAFGLGGILVEVFKDITFRLAPASKEDALSMLDGIQAAEVLKGVRGAQPVDRDALANIINGGFAGEIYPINPKADEILGKKAYKSVKDIPSDVDVAVFAVPAKFCAAAMEEVGEKGIPGAVMIPSGFAEVGEKELQDELLAVARKHNVRIMGPNI